MSNALAIATVTATLNNFLQGQIGLDVPGATVTTLRPDGTEGGNPNPRVNIYAYQITPNASLRNLDVATRRSDGSLMQQPQVALDIHYLLSFYGNESRLEPQRMLGRVAQALHTQPLLTRTMIRTAIQDPNFDFLATSDLAEQVERVRFTPVVLNLEELSKIWSVFFQVRHTISVAYQASVVLIEADETPRTALPVRDRNLYILPFCRPMIEQVYSIQAPYAPIVSTSRLKILGRQLKSQDQETLVRIGDTEVRPTQVRSTELEVDLGAFPADALRAGIQGIQVVQPMLLGTPPTRHDGPESNVAAIVLRPTMTVGPVEVTRRIDRDGVTYCTGTLQLENFSPVVGPQQRVVLLLNEFQPVSQPTARSYQVKAPRLNGMTNDSDQESTQQITFGFETVVSGAYLVRVQVNGAESLLTFAAADPTQPDRQQYVSPQVRIE